MIGISLILAVLIMIGFVWLTLRFWDRHDLENGEFDRRQLVLWAVKGMAVPLFVWMLLNAGISPRFPALLAWVGAAKGPGGQWFSAWLRLVLPAVFVLSSFWAAATFLWFVATHALEMECDRRDLVFSFLLWSGLLSPIVAFLLYLGRFGSGGLITVLVLVPVVSELLALGKPRKRTIHPVYSRALKKIQAGKYTAAEKEVIRQLRKRDSDFEGWMLLAELYANHFHDLPEADQLVHELCRQPDLTRDQMSDAFHRLADWHLKPGNDRAAAQRVLEELCEAFPATHFGDVARQRINRLLIGQA